MQLRLFTLILLSVFTNYHAFGQSETYLELWDDPEIQTRIENGIETHRKGWFTLDFVDENNEPLQNATVSIEQTDHEFLFGSNIFMYQGYPDQKQNQRYEEVFAQLFNYASLPFYWEALEPEPGTLRFDASSSKIYRRPPPEPILEFCKNNGITPKGHTLVWDNPRWSIPAWLPENAEEREHLINKRIREIGESFGEEIKYWDVVNELRNRRGHMQVVMPKDFALKAFQQTEQAFPRENVLILNEVTNVWEEHADEYSHFYLVTDNLLMKGAKIDALGFQCHFFHGEQQFQDVLNGDIMQPKRILDIMDTYADFQLPIHITEITIPTLPNNSEGEKAQATVTENLYKIWFSHPNVEAITWWNVSDGTATANEDKWNGGFLRKDLSPKPSYEVLNRLINQEWKTSLENQQLTGSTLKIHGFYGEYVLTIQHEGKTIEKKVKLSKKGLDHLQIKL